MKKRFPHFLLMICTALFLCFAVTAAADGDILHARNDGRNLLLYVNAPSWQIGRVYVGNDECTAVAKGPMGVRRTIILLDNSRSINQNFRPLFAKVIKRLVENGNEGDIYTLATYSEEITYLVRSSSDAAELQAAVDTIVYRNQDSYLTNVLVGLLDALGADPDLSYTRIVVLADGADDELLGITDTELTEKLRGANVPVYVVGCNMNYNAETLKRMQSFARASGGKDFLVGEKDAEEIVSGIDADRDCVKLTVTPPDTVCDGTVKTVRVNIGSSYSTAQVTMPFIPSNAAASSIAENAGAGQGTAAKQSSYIELFGYVLPSLTVYIISGILLLIIIAAIVLILVLSAKNRRKAAEEASAVEEEPVSEAVPEIGNTVIEEKIVSDLDTPAGDDYEMTVRLSDVRNVKLHLEDLADPSKTFEAPIKKSVLIGKDPNRCQIVINYSHFVSGVNCEIIPRGSTFVVRDGGAGVAASTNGTYVNDRRAEPELPLPSGSVLRIGDLQFRVSYRA